MKRRSFLAAALAACAAPAYVKAGILMPVKKVWTPAWIGIDYGTDYGADAWGMVRWMEAGADGVPVFRHRLISRDEAMWTPDELAAIRRHPEPPLVFNQISVTDWPKVAAAKDEKNRRLTRMLAGLP